MRLKRRPLLGILLASYVAAGCGQDSDNVVPACGDFGGMWKVTLSPVNSDCGGTSSPEIVLSMVTQNGCSFTWVPIGITGTLSDNTIAGTFERTSTDESVTEEFTGSLSADGSTVTGTAQWTYRNSSSAETCNGTTQLSGARVPD